MSSNEPAPLSKHAEIAQRIIGGVVAAGNPAVSPDGTQIAFVVATTNMEKNKGRAPGLGFFFFFLPQNQPNLNSPCCQK